MKILMLTPYLPYPLYSGGQIRTYNLLKNLSKKHEITLFSFIRNISEKDYVDKLKDFCVDVKVFLKRPPWSLTSLALSAVTVYPLVVCLYLKRSLMHEIQKAIQQGKFDLIHAETFYVMPNIPQNNIPTILVEQTIEYLVYQHYTETVRLLPQKILMDFDVLKIRFWEKKFWQKASRVVAMSHADKKVMQSMIPHLTVDLVPNGVDTDFFSLRMMRKINNTKKILFVGNFKWLQNREAVMILVNNIWPEIKKKIRDAKLWIVGRYPTNDILRYASDSIEITSDIADIRDAYNQSDILLAPIYGPGGTRYKILEAMATGIPVVTTSTGIEGLGVKHGVEAYIGDNPKDLASGTVRLLTDAKLYQYLVSNGRRLVEENFNWKIIARNLDKIYRNAINEKQS